MNETPQKKTWLTAVADTAKEQGVSLPTFTVRGMGTARSAIMTDGRFVTMKRRLVAATQADIDGIEWTLWQEWNGLPQPVATFRESQHPQQENITTALSLLKGWLLDGWSSDSAKAAVARHPRCQAVENLIPPAEAATEARQPMPPMSPPAHVESTADPS